MCVELSHMAAPHQISLFCGMTQVSSSALSESAFLPTLSDLLHCLVLHFGLCYALLDNSQFLMLLSAKLS